MKSEMCYGSKIQITENTRLLDNQGKKNESRPCIKEQKVLPRGKIENTARLNERNVGCETK